MPDTPASIAPVPASGGFEWKRQGLIALGLVVGLALIAFGGDDSAKPAEGTPAGEVANVDSKSSTLTKELRNAQDDVIQARSKDVRRDAARLIHESPGQTSRFVELAAELELASRCPDKRTVVEEMRTLGDPRVLPALIRLAESPRRGCGIIRLSDCFGCLRRELDQTIEVLEGVGR